jgi:hypothetical protein
MVIDLLLMWGGMTRMHGILCSFARCVIVAEKITKTIVYEICIVAQPVLVFSRAQVAWTSIRVWDSFDVLATCYGLGLPSRVLVSLMPVCNLFRPQMI